MSRQALSLALLCLVTLQVSITFSDASLPGLVAQPPSGARPAGGRGRPTVATVAEDDHLPVLTPKPPVPRAGSVAPSQRKAPEPTLCRRFADLDVFAQAVAHLKPDADKSVTEIKSEVERQFVVEGLEHIRGALSHVTQVTQSTYEHHYLPGVAAEAAKRAELEASPHYRPEGITEVHNLVPALSAGIKEAKKFQCHASYEFFWAMLQGWQGAVKGMTTTRPKPVVALGKGVDVALKCLAHVILHEGCEPPKESQRIPEQFTATRTISNTELAQLRKQAYSHRF